ncbi:MAG: DUF4019 domain-containing protein [FCB group bacterium]|nr:DUF4019 domain-containing protein [FCB group bacterium]
MSNSKYFVIGMLILGMIGCGKKTQGTTALHKNLAAEQAAIESALVWLELIDNGDYLGAWAVTSDSLKTSVAAMTSSNEPEKAWETGLRSTRDPKLKIKSRKVTGQSYSKTSFTFPGPWVDIYFDSISDDNVKYVEHITSKLDSDNKWRVYAYYFKKEKK